MRTTATMGALLAVGVALLMALALPGFAAATAPNPTAPPQQWAYQGNGYYNASSGSTLTGDLTIHAYYTWVTIVTQTNTSTTSYTLEAQRAASAVVFVNYCYPQCANAQDTANLTVTGWEADSGFANLTTAATVTVNGTSAAALGLENSQAYAKGNVTATASYDISAGGQTYDGSAYASGAASGQASLSFSPSLGLVPNNLYTNEVWNSSSTYTASGSYEGAYHYWYNGIGTGANSSGSGSGAPSGSVSGSGPISLAGQDYGMITLHNGATVPVLGLSLSTGGRFTLVDGVIVVPTSGSAMNGGGAGLGSSSASGWTSSSTSQVDWGTSASGHMGPVASETSVSASSSIGLGSTLAQPMTGTSAGMTAQAQPTSVANAQQQYNNILNPAGPGSHSSLLIVLVVVGVVAVVVIVAAVAIGMGRSRKGRLPPNGGYAQYPPMGAYTVPAGVPPPPPTGAPYPPAPGAPTVPPRAQAPNPQDPLGHLW